MSLFLFHFGLLDALRSIITVGHLELLELTNDANQIIVGMHAAEILLLL